MQKTAYKNYVAAAKALREACHREGIEINRLGLMSLETRGLWKEKQRAGQLWLAEDDANRWH